MLPLRVCLEIQGSALGGTEQKKPFQLEQTTHHSVLLTLLCHGRVRNCSSCMNFTHISNNILHGRYNRARENGSCTELLPMAQGVFDMNSRQGP